MKKTLLMGGWIVAALCGVALSAAAQPVTVPEPPAAVVMACSGCKTAQAETVVAQMPVAAVVADRLAVAQHQAHAGLVLGRTAEPGQVQGVGLRLGPCAAPRLLAPPGS